ncbi:ABC transporter ATP-binding protein [Oceanobacillus neutriphilus]|uniref:ABC transporter ATP-binding protein n=1 Tax=Oceanobacillus neutriphilus TaxID=531815 RepID=A0ABQ2NUE1_9BACI|nr:ABC transporter ATP-binding protein [Oceanobacillus neutriphilus]GGP10751.1 ABC transporter ATP-binding protein [Oceanobacillus neutriphilus]
MREQNQKLALQFKNVDFHYKNDAGGIPILKNMNLSVADGEFVSIIGASGSGKSTIFRLIVGLEEQTGGSIYLNEKRVTDRSGKVGYMPQQDLLMPWRTVQQNAALPLELHKESRLGRRAVPDLLEAFGLKGYEDKYPHELSGGMRQRVSFLRATLSGSNVLLLDEPFSALDAMTRLFMQEWLLEQWEEQQSTILFITHDISEALFLSDRIFVITDTPFTTLKEIEVPLERPRRQQDSDKKEVMKLKNNLLEQFRMRV